MFANNKYEEALALYKKCTEIKSDSYDSWYQCGLCRYREALDLNNTISSITASSNTPMAIYCYLPVIYFPSLYFQPLYIALGVCLKNKTKFSF